MATGSIYAKCTPAIRTDIRDCSTLTASSADIPTPSDLDTMFLDTGAYRIMRALFMTQFDLALNDVQMTPFQKFLMANHVDVSKRINKEVIAPGQERIQPYILGTRKGQLNNDVWFGINGTASSSNWQIDVYSPTGIPSSVSWFNPGDYVYLQGMTDDGTKTVGMYQVASRTISTVYVRLVLTKLNAATFLPSARVGDPVNAIVLRGPNNITEWESYCYTIPGLIAGNIEPFWYQTSRGPVLCEDTLTREYRELIFKGNDLYAKFYDLPMTEYNRQTGEDWVRRMCEGYMWNKPLANQSLETLSSLADIQITDFISNTRYVGKRANAIGWYEQHAQNGRVIDLQGGRVSIPSLANSMYAMMQLREANKVKAPDIFDLCMPSTMMPGWQHAFMKYWKDRGVSNYDKVLDPKYEQSNGSLGFKFRTFQLEWPDIEIRVITDRFFDHRLDLAIKLGTAASDTRLGNLARQLWILPWQFNYVGILGSKRVVNSSGTLAERAKVIAADRCKMAVEQVTTTMNSTTWCPISELPNAGLIIDNIGKEDPDETNDGGDYETMGGACAEIGAS